jgi:hypothetical protein
MKEPSQWEARPQPKKTRQMPLWRIWSLAVISPIGFHLYHVEKGYKNSSSEEHQKPAEVPIYIIQYCHNIFVLFLDEYF